MKFWKQALLSGFGAFVLMAVVASFSHQQTSNGEARSESTGAESLRAEILKAQQQAKDAQSEMAKAQQQAKDAQNELEKVRQQLTAKSKEEVKQLAPTETIVTITAPAKPATELKVAAACKLQGKVVGIADGDTITVLDAQKVQHKIRLAGIDAPVKTQPFGNAAKKHLSTLIGKNEVCVESYKLDNYKRKVGIVRVDGKDVNYQMVKDGYAWWFKKYQNEQTPADRVLYEAAHAEAKSTVIGLWSEPDPIEPDAWRAGERPKVVSKQQKVNVTQAKRLVQENSSGMSCGGKRYCKEMNSCAEACFYLQQCGLDRLDRDSDGIPCESICGRRC